MYGMEKVQKILLSSVCAACLMFLGVTQSVAGEEQIVMEDLTPSQLRSEIKKIETEFYRVFNSSVEDKKLMIVCSTYTPTGSNRKVENCEPQFAADRRADNSQQSRFGNDILFSQQALNAELAPQYEELTAAMTKLAAENQYFRELDGILGALRDELASR